MLNFKPTMKTKLPVLALVVALGGSSGAAQSSSTDDWKPATTNQRGKQYPQVNSEGRVRAQVIAPETQSVQLANSATQSTTLNGTMSSGCGLQPASACWKQEGLLESERTSQFSR